MSHSKPALLGRLLFCRHKTHVALMDRSAALQLLKSFAHQPLKLLHLLLSKMGLKCHNLLEILCLGDLFDQRES